MGGGTADEIVKPRLQEMASLPIPPELMEEILFRLPTTADLASASAVCDSIRHVATDRSFLRRYRKLHPAPLLGFLEEGMGKQKIFHPAAPPYPSAREATAASLAADFSFSFLPAPASSWALRDTRDGRVLLDKPVDVHAGHTTFVFPKVVVCDPLHRQYLVLPPIPVHLAASMEDPSLRQLRVEIFLVPTGDETSFRVIWMAQYTAMLLTFDFSSNTGQWLSRRWSDLSGILFYARRYVYGCFYWITSQDDFQKCTPLLVLDINTMEFSIAEAPHEVHSCSSYCMVETREGRPGMFVLELCGSKLSWFIRQNDGPWQKVKTILLGSAGPFICNMDKFPVLYLGERAEAGCFTLNMETFQFEEVCAFAFESTSRKLQAYSNFPPSLLSSSTI